MDVERTIEILLKNRARMAARTDAKIAGAGLRMNRLEG